MNKYLLLRDNKQTGPYTAQELSEKGLKPYDLVWLEGRSAAWRYPGEIEELKSFAPGVEEQPYDRFYKKQDGGQSTEQAAATTNVVEESQPVTKKVEQTSKHIYVTMPGGSKAPVAKKEEAVKPVAQQSDKNANSAATKNTEKKAAASSYIISEEDDELNSSMLKGFKNRQIEDEEINSGFLSDYESRKAAYSNGSKSTGSAVAVKETVAEKPVAPKKESWSTPAKKEQFDLKALLAGSGKYLQNNKNLTRVLVAVVLILGGVVIGLVINKGSHQPDTQALESLVKEIREQQNEKTSSTVPATETTQNNNPRHNNGRREEEPTNNEEAQNIGEAPSATAAANNALPNHQQRPSVIKKDNIVVPPPPAQNNKSIALPASNTSSQPIEATPAVIETREKPINPEVIEKARKNIYEQVRAEASAYKVGVFGGVSDLDITLVNTSLYTLDQVAVEVKYYGMEKKLVKTQTIIFNNVPPGKRRTLEVPKTSRGITIDCTVTSINSKALGLAQAGF